MPAGRPTKYKKKFCQELVDHMEKGMSYETFGAVIDVSVQTLYDWEKVHPEFLEAKRKGFLVRQSHIEEHFAQVSEGKGEGVPSLMIFRAKNLLGWTDKQEVQQSGDININISYGDAEEDAD